MIKNLEFYNNLNKELDVLYFTDNQEYQKKIKSLTLEDLVHIQENLRFERANDPNFSFAKEKVTCALAGVNHHALNQKHGLDSDQNAESKPESIIEGGKKQKLSGQVSFADMEIHKINSLYDNNTLILSSGFVGSKCLYVLGIHMKNDNIKKRLLEQHDYLTKKGKRKVLSFSRKYYADDKNNILFYKHPEFESFKNYMAKPHYDFINQLSKVN